MIISKRYFKEQFSLRESKVQKKIGTEVFPFYSPSGFSLDTDTHNLLYLNY